MACNNNKPVLTLAKPDDLRSFREVFARADYTDNGLLGTLGPIDLPTRIGPDLPHFLRLTSRGRPLDTLIRLFLLGVPIEREAARRALEPVPLEKWVRAGLIELRDSAVLALIKLMQFRELLLAVDQPELPEVGVRPDQVMPLTGSTIALANFAVRRPSRKTLDLGTGCGVLALLAARHSDQVYAADLSARSLAYALFNARLNHVSNVHFLEGDLFAPVRGHQFDLVLSNPPFAVTPSARYLYRDSGLGSDAVCRRIIQEAPQFLTEGGLCQIICDLVHIAGQDWKERLASWFEGSGCDTWVLRTDTHDAPSYARMWIRDTEHGSPETLARLYEEWVSYYDRERIEAISTGLIALRRSSGRSNWVRIEDAPEGMARPFGDCVAREFKLRDFLETMRSDQKLLDQKLRVSPDMRLNQQCEWAEGTWRIVSAQIRLAHGLPYVGNVDRNAVTLITRCDGQHSLRELLAQMAAADRADLEKITPECLAVVRQLIERGFLLPAGVEEEPS